MDNQSQFTNNSIDRKRTESREMPWQISSHQSEAKLITFIKQEPQNAMIGERFNSAVNPATSTQNAFESPSEGEDRDPDSPQYRETEIPETESEWEEDVPEPEQDSATPAEVVPQTSKRWYGRILSWMQAKPPQPKDGRKPWYRRPSIWVGLGVVTAGGGAMGYGGWKFYQLYQNLPEVTDLSSYSRDGTLTIKAADGTIIMQRGPATHEKVKLEEMPDQLIKAFVATEDRRFYEHKGVDYQGIVRAFGANLLARDVVEGGSTITQQLARTVFLDQERSVVRKLREALLAIKIERQMTKEEILEKYLNLVYLGSGAYGVADASQV
ncbi:MAG: biosynthetic peptidoglycan transglycosylase, partial [Cyanobacteriota bacterium]|nr:biosynthetic peptidoglycan transglycosylase [Cyanobacteriota bacterium]